MNRAPYRQTLLLCEIFTSILNELAPEQVVYWTRRNSGLKEILSRKPDPDKCDPLFPCEPPPEYAGNLFESDRYGLSLAAKFMRESANLSDKERSYWIENPGGLKRLLCDDGIMLIGDCLGTATVMPETSWIVRDPTSLIKLSKPFRDYLKNTHAMRYSHHYPATGQMTASFYPVNCFLFLKEVIEIADKENGLRDSLFTLPQIISLSRTQNKLGKPGPLSFKRPNYFPVLTQDKNVGLIGTWWHGEYKENGWRMHFTESVREDGILAVSS